MQTFGQADWENHLLAITHRDLLKEKGKKKGKKGSEIQPISKKCFKLKEKLTGMMNLALEYFDFKNKFYCNPTWIIWQAVNDQIS